MKQVAFKFPFKNSSVRLELGDLHVESSKEMGRQQIKHILQT